VDDAQGVPAYGLWWPLESGAIDPVCGMDVAPRTGYTKMIGEHAYRFCSRACLDKFETNPQQYAA
jgi:YHS domain-containing protein